jgi:hypothetical protein
MGHLIPHIKQICRLSAFKKLLTFHQSTNRNQPSPNKEYYDDGPLKNSFFAIYALVVLLDKPIFMKPDAVLKSIAA